MVILLMGIAGAGKTTVGEALAAALRWRFCDADAFHSTENVDKLRRGIPLTDEDRAPWLREIRTALRGWIERGESVVLACSVLKTSYRDHIVDGHDAQVKIVYLKADPSLLRRRLVERTGHFMGESLLASQLAILEEPTGALVLDAGQAAGVLVEQIRHAFSL
jgi:gluconokinase